MRSAEEIALPCLNRIRAHIGSQVGMEVIAAIKVAQREAAEQMRERCAMEVGTRPADTKRADRFRREATDAIRALPVEEPPK